MKWHPRVPDIHIIGSDRTAKRLYQDSSPNNGRYVTCLTVKHHQVYVFYADQALLKSDASVYLLSIQLNQFIELFPRKDYKYLKT